MKEKLVDAAKALKKVIKSKELNIVSLEQSLTIYGVKPVMVKANFEKLINEGAIDKGRIVQYQNCVMYTPNGSLKFYDEHYSI